MNTPATHLVVVVLNVAPGLEEPIIDWLLGREGEKGFTSSTVYGHSSLHGDLSAAEQVSGRRRRIQFEIHMAHDAAAAFIEDAFEDFGAADVHCVVMPALAAGSLEHVRTELS
jgi:hypothetical protein